MGKVFWTSFLIFYILFILSLVILNNMIGPFPQYPGQVLGPESITYNETLVKYNMEIIYFVAFITLAISLFASIKFGMTITKKLASRLKGFSVITGLIASLILFLILFLIVPYPLIDARVGHNNSYSNIGFINLEVFLYIGLFGFPGLIIIVAFGTFKYIKEYKKSKAINEESNSKANNKL